MNDRMWTAATVVTIGIALTISSASAKEPQPGKAQQVKRGQYLVEFGGCHDCHTPKKMGASGQPEPILSRALSGHPADMKLTPAPKLPPGTWIASTTGTMTAWSGPWGVSYAANLTPDPETGLGKWTLRNFVESMRTGRHMGRGRPILPPMPFYDVAKLTDADLSAVFAYLKSIPAIENRVPDPTPPDAAAAPADTPAASSGGAPGSGGQTGSGSGR